MSVPKLFGYADKIRLPESLIEDMNLDKLLSREALQILLYPCSSKEIARRHELFALTATRIETVSSCLDMLRSYRHTLEVWRGSTVLLERYYLHRRVLCEYADICGVLASFGDCGELLGNVAAYFKSKEITAHTEYIYSDMEAVRAKFEMMQNGLISLSDKSWLTPSDGVCDEFDELSKYVKSMGLDVPPRKRHTARLDITLSDALMNLYTDEISEIERIFARYKMLVPDDLCEYIDELSFVLEISELVNRAKLAAIPYCFADIASEPCMCAKQLYDVSLLVKKSDGIIPNDADFTPNTPFKFLIGANGGGKTTYLRSVGINLVLFLAGCPIFASEARIYPFSFAASHFPADERFDGIGRLDEERQRCEKMLAVRGCSFFLFNETYSGADEKRGFELLCDTVERLHAAGHFGLYVTHFHKVVEGEYPVLSVQVDVSDNNRRTFRVVDAKGAASSYALDILKKYGLDRISLEKRRCEDEGEPSVSDG